VKGWTMAGVTRFEDLIAWQKARELAAAVFRLTRTTAFERDWGFANQIRRAAVSVGSNIAEGFERSRPKEFHQFLSVAKGSCAELRSQLYTALDTGLISENEFGTTMAIAEETSRVINGLRASLNT
jgi:four helix bundle protein